MSVESNVERQRHRGAKVLAVLLHIGLTTVAVMAIKFAVIHFVDTMRPASHWIVYESVEPVAERWPLGARPVFRSRATRFHAIRMTWNDLMYCRDTEGHLKGKLRHVGTAPKGAEVLVPAASIGYDEQPLVPNTTLAVLDGYWTWQGPMPYTPSVCFLVPQPMIYPSPGVTPKVVGVPVTGTFEFYRPQPPIKRLNTDDADESL